MIELLVSIKNKQEARVALAADANLLDLKDPAVGALGNLDNAICREIIQTVNKTKMVSATVGEHHQNAKTLLGKVDEKLALGVHIIKLSLAQFFDDEAFLMQLKRRIMFGQTKFIGVMFADQLIDLTMIAPLAKIGFYGVMLDTDDKRKSLPASATIKQINAFVTRCKAKRLVVGLAGSLRIEDVQLLADCEPNYLGFRSGVCIDNARGGAISAEKIYLIKSTLREYNE